MKNLGQLADEGLRVWATWPPAVVAYPTIPHLKVDGNFDVIGASVSIVVRVVLCKEAGDLDDETCCTHLNSIVAETGCGWGVGEGGTSFWLAELKSGQDQVCPSKVISSSLTESCDLSISFTFACIATIAKVNLTYSQAILSQFISLLHSTSSLPCFQANIESCHAHFVHACWPGFEYPAVCSSALPHFLHHI